MAPRSKKQFEALREASIKKILDAALELFGTIGYDTTSIAQIAKKAGVSKGLIYNYFESKEALVKGLIEKIFHDGEREILNQMTEDPRGNLEAIIQMAFKWLREHQHINRLMVNLMLQVDKFDFVHQITVDKVAEYLALFEHLLMQINYPDYKTEARLLTIMFDGIGAQYMMLRENYPLDEIEEMLIRKYCK